MKDDFGKICFESQFDYRGEDIHTLREYNYEKTKHMTDEERMDYYNKRGREVQKKLEKMKAL